MGFLFLDSLYISTMRHPDTSWQWDIQLQLNPAIADLKGPTSFIHYRWISSIANINIENLFEGQKSCFCCGQVQFDPLLWDSTVLFNNETFRYTMTMRHPNTSWQQSLEKHEREKKRMRNWELEAWHSWQDLIVSELFDHKNTTRKQSGNDSRLRHFHSINDISFDKTHGMSFKNAKY